MSLENAIARLLCDTTFRRRIAAGDLDDLDPDAREALTDIDVARVEAAAIAVVREVRTRRHRGVGSLEEIYAAVLGEVSEPAREALFARFVASRSYAAHGGSAEDPGLSLEEAFARFLLDDCDGFSVDVVDRTFLRAFTRSLAICGEPSFAVPSRVLRRARGWCVVAHGPTLFAAIDGRALEGPIDDVIAAMVRSATSAGALDAAADHGLASEAGQRLFDELERMGIAPSP